PGGAPSAASPPRALQRSPPAERPPPSRSHPTPRTPSPSFRRDPYPSGLSGDPARSPSHGGRRAPDRREPPPVDAPAHEQAPDLDPGPWLRSATRARLGTGVSRSAPTRTRVAPAPSG